MLAIRLAKKQLGNRLGSLVPDVLNSEKELQHKEIKGDGQREAVYCSTQLDGTTRLGECLNAVVRYIERSEDERGNCTGWEVKMRLVMMRTVENSVNATRLAIVWCDFIFISVIFNR